MSFPPPPQSVQYDLRSSSYIAGKWWFVISFPIIVGIGSRRLPDYSRMTVSQISYDEDEADEWYDDMLDAGYLADYNYDELLIQVLS
jgi:hypothetical protein